VRNKK